MLCDGRHDGYGYEDQGDDGDWRYIKEPFSYPEEEYEVKNTELTAAQAEVERLRAANANLVAVLNELLAVTRPTLGELRKSKEPAIVWLTRPDQVDPVIARFVDTDTMRSSDGVFFTTRRIARIDRFTTVEGEGNE